MQLSMVYSTTSGTMTATAPAYDSGWATEIALDVPWAHATAPLARIVLIEAPDASTTSLLAAVTLANNMGPGPVSMSFGASEGSRTSSLESTLAAANMTYLAATGDSGSGVEWPSVSPHVLAVAGTSLTYSGSDSRFEITWASTGGGISGFVASGFVGKDGTASTGTITITDPGVSSLNISISGVPMGVSFAVNGLTMTASWASPVLGNYTLLVKVTDAAGLSSQLSVPLTVAAK